MNQLDFDQNIKNTMSNADQPTERNMYVNNM